MDKLKKIKKAMSGFWSAYELKIVLIIGFILVAILAFEAGFLWGQRRQNTPITIEKPLKTANLGVETPSATTSENPKATQNPQNNQANPDDCQFVGSKNSNKYHLPTCQWAKRIKPENLVCFKSVEEAVAKGYQPDKGCIK